MAEAKKTVRVGRVEISEDFEGGLESLTRMFSEHLTKAQLKELNTKLNGIKRVTSKAKKNSRMR